MAYIYDIKDNQKKKKEEEEEEVNLLRNRKKF